MAIFKEIKQVSQLGVLDSQNGPKDFFGNKGLPFDPANDALRLEHHGVAINLESDDNPAAYPAFDLASESMTAAQVYGEYQLVHLYLPQARRFDKTTHASDLGVHVFGVVLDKPKNLLDPKWRFMVNAVYTTDNNSRMVVTMDTTKVLPDELHAYIAQHDLVLRDLRAFAASGVEVRANAITACEGIAGGMRRKLDHQLPVEEVVRINSPGARYLLAKNGTSTNDIKEFDLGRMHSWVHNVRERRLTGADVFVQFSPTNPNEKGVAEFYSNVLVFDGSFPVQIVLNPLLTTTEGLASGVIEPVYVDGQALDDARKAKLFTTLQTKGAEDNLAVLVDKATRMSHHA